MLKEIKSGTIFGTAVIQVEKLNDGKGSSEKSTKPLRDFNFVNRVTLEWFWNEMKGFCNRNMHLMIKCDFIFG